MEKAIVLDKVIELEVLGKGYYRGKALERNNKYNKWSFSLRMKKRVIKEIILLNETNFNKFNALTDIDIAAINEDEVRRYVIVESNNIGEKVRYGGITKEFVNIFEPFIQQEEKEEEELNNQNDGYIFVI
jgi:hypothetical protein